METATVVQVLRYCPPRIEYKQCDSKPWETTGAVIGGIFGALIALGGYDACLKTQQKQRRTKYLDVSQEVIERFVAGIDKPMGEKLTTVEQCLEDDPPQKLKEAFGASLAFDFKVTSWVLVETASGDQYFHLPGKLRSSLFDLEDGEVLWQEVCKLPGGALRTPKRTAEDLQDEMQLAAQQCADKLAESF